MKMKKLNTAQVCTVIMLLIVAILVLIKVLFSDMKGFEWGSVSDWFSTAGTLGTLLIAWMAYRKADGYIEKQRVSHGIDIAKDLICESFVPYFQSLNDFNIRLISLKQRLELMGMSEDKIDPMPEFQLVNSSIQSLFNHGFNIEKEILKLHLLKILPSESFKYRATTNHERLQKIDNSYKVINNHVFETKSQFSLDNDLIFNKIRLMDHLSKEIMSEVKEYFDIENSLYFYFNIHSDQT